MYALAIDTMALAIALFKATIDVSELQSNLKSNILI